MLGNSVLWDKENQSQVWKYKMSRAEASGEESESYKGKLGAENKPPHQIFKVKQYNRV